MSLRVIVNGAAGRMGTKIVDMVEKADNMEVACKVDYAEDPERNILASIDDFDGEADVVIDFSFHGAAPKLLESCIKRDLPVVIATTGHTDEEKELIKEASGKIAIFQSANMSVGIALLKRMAKEAAALFPGSEVEIIEAHHDQKKDAPSGTALMIADAVKEVKTGSEYVFGRHGESLRTKEEIGIHSLRMGNVTGEHEVIFAMPNETIRIKHEAHDRALFADGALAAARFLVGKAPGMYGMEDLLGE